jgi:hypothetical protein
MKQYTTEELEQMSIELIEKHQIISIKELASFLPISRQSFYNHGLDKFDSIKDSMERIKTSTANELRIKWKNSDNATLQVALMKLVASDEDRKRLATSYMETKQKHTTVDLSELSTDDIVNLLKDDEQ